MTLGSEDALGRFRQVIGRHLGFRVDESRLAALFSQRVEQRTDDAEAYLLALERAGPTDDEVVELVVELTVPETYFFRHAEQFAAFTNHALPDRMLARASTRTLRILSAGCASGEEAYSLAILTRERVAPDWDVKILAVDVNPVVLAKALRATYSAWSLRETPPTARHRWFRTSGSEFVLDPAIAGAVTFELVNLAEAEAMNFPDGVFDFVFCRNVIMYFTPEIARAAIDRLAASIAPRAYLFLGYAETLRGLSQAFQLCHTHGAFYYRKKTDSFEAPNAPDPLLPTTGRADRGNWWDEIRNASLRVNGLACERERSDAPRPSAELQRFDHDRALDLLRDERFDEALALVRAVPAGPERDVQVTLLEAVLLAQRGELDQSEAECQKLLGRDELNAAAHYVLALCREGRGNRPAAIEHYQISAYLDPTFALPHLHHGRLARAAGDVATARRELGQAQVLLQREEPPRIVLFGGGFNRDALLALCRAELVASGGGK